MGTIKEKVSKALINRKDQSISVVQLDLDGKFVKEFPSMEEAKRQGFNNRHISSCCRGLRKTHSKYRWMFKKDYLSQQEGIEITTTKEGEG